MWGLAWRCCIRRCVKKRSNSGAKLARWWSWPILPAVLEPAHRLAHQLRRAAQIPLRIGDVHMAEVGGQDRQSALGILIGPIPAHECAASRIDVCRSCRRGP